MSHVVFVHRDGAGQFEHLSAHLSEKGIDVTVICDAPVGPMRNVRVVAQGEGTRARRGRLGDAASQCVENGYRTADTLARLSLSQGPPDVVIGHIGWGHLLFVKDVLPQTPALGYCEYFFRRHGGDIGFDPKEPVTTEQLTRARVRNMVQRATLESIEAGLSPTMWQRGRYPEVDRRRIAVCHEGVDIDVCCPDPAARFTLPGGRIVAAGDPIVTYAARSLEPYRGFDRFMRAATKIARRNSKALFLVAGGDDVSYGRRPKGGGTWREAMMKETGLDPSRIVFLGSLDHASLIRLFQVSAVHVYLTVPFVLSWSVLEAMACGCLVVGSRTAPVEEVIADGRNGMLVDFWNDELVDAVLGAIDKPDLHRPLRAVARASIERNYRRADCMRRQIGIISGIASQSDNAMFARAS